ncbi:MAG: squalene/phytoene synthase family protein [Gammaproteobacteria bacterium]
MQDEFRFPNIATPPGSSAYYLVRFSPPALRDRQAVLFAWRRELQRLQNSSDPGIARLKLDFWRRELQPEQLAQSRHPLARMIHAQLPHEAARLSELADLTEREILAGQSRDWEQLVARCGAVGGAFASLLTSAYTDDAGHQGSAESIGLVDETTRLLQRIGRKEYLQRFPPLESADAAKTIAGWILDLRRRATQASQALPPGPAAAQLAIARALLDTFSREPGLLLEASIDLTPIKKLWLVWRNRSRMRQ